jgi:crotonobetainyl-CoA:carnitine CoA-transferase CaiB-like acyl-CoA transferase
MNAFAIMAALWYRERTGQGQKVANNLVNTAVLMQWPALAHFLAEGIEFKKEGRGGVRSRFPYAAYPAKDGYVLTIFGQDDTEWAIVCEILGIEHLLGDPRYDTVEKRNARREELYPVLDEAFRQATREEWVERFRARQLRCDPCLDYAEFTSHEQFEVNHLAVTVDDPRDGEFQIPASPVRFGAFPPAETARHSPILGEHTREILGELGYADAEIDAMANEGAVALAIPAMFEAKRSLKGKEARQGGVPRGRHGEQRKAEERATKQG